MGQNRGMTEATFLGTALPLIQAPRASAQDARLAIAVGEAGALGSLPAAMLDAAALERELRLLHASGRPYNVNFFVHTPPAPDPAREARWRTALAPYYAELGLQAPPPGAGASRRPFSHEAAEVLEAFRPAFVSFHFGLPAPELLARVKRMGSRVLSSATTVREALWLQANGADAVIAQGLEAGGHRGHFLDKDPALQAGTATLLPQVVRPSRFRSSPRAASRTRRACARRWPRAPARCRPERHSCSVTRPTPRRCIARRWRTFRRRRR